MSIITQTPPPNTIHLSIDDSAEWLACWPQIMAYGPNTYIKLVTDEITVNLYASRDKLTAVLESLLTELKRAKPEAKKAYTMAELANLPLTHPARANFIAQASPAQLLELIQYMPALAPHLPEFQQVFSNHIQCLSSDIARVEQAGLSPNDLLNDLGQPIHGAQTKIGQALGIPNAGQANRERIMDVLDIMRNRKTTTTPTSAQYIAVEEAIA